MARTLLTAQPVVRTGLEASYTAGDAANGHSFVNTGAEIIHIVNGSGSSRTLTIDNPVTVDGIAVPDPTVSITAGEERFIGPFPSFYEQDDTSQATTLENCILFGLDSATSVTVAILSVSRVS